MTIQDYADMDYVPDGDYHWCKNRKHLEVAYIKYAKSKTGYAVLKITQSWDTECSC